LGFGQLDRIEIGIHIFCLSSLANCKESFVEENVSENLLIVNGVKNCLDCKLNGSVGN